MIRLLIAAVFLHICFIAAAQCNNPIHTFPYNESFETSNGGWFAGGNSPGWAWGIPSKPVINKAAGGDKCWITATLNQSAYNNNENSTLTSPCFDFSFLTSPYIRFKVFWETENKYDGASFQYSIDGGNTWTDLGSYTDYTNCPGSNWFNTTSITALGSPGWSGNIQPTASCSGGAGNGSGEWRLAQHGMPELAGQTNVLFRFRFAAGSICNNYDGFAIDDIWIGEASVALSADFAFTCSSNNTINFTAFTSACFGSFSWNFGDPASGVNNTSALPNPTHVFSAPGQYNVTFSFIYGGPITPPIVKQIDVFSVAASIVDPLKCFGDRNGSLLADVPIAGTFTYSWNTDPPQTNAIATGLGAGDYTVTVSSAQSCPVTANIILTEPQKLDHGLTITDPYCGFINGKALIESTGGTQPYTYLWIPAVAIGASSDALAPGDYQVVTRDNNNCTDTSFFTLINQNPLTVSLGEDRQLCPGEKLVLNPGVFSAYQWQDNSSAPTYAVTQTGEYSVRVIDNEGCTASDTVFIDFTCPEIYFPSAFSPNDDGLNDMFGPLGSLPLLGNYHLYIYNRWGELVFHSVNPYEKWNGWIKGQKAGSGIYIWYSNFSLQGKPKETRKGAITLIR